MTHILTFQRGETIPIYRNVKNSAGTPVTPGQGCTLTLRDPDGTLAVAIDDSNIEDKAMVFESQGIYYYHFRSLATDKKGEWNWSAKATDGTDDDAIFDIKKGSFNLT